MYVRRGCGVYFGIIFVSFMMAFVTVEAIGSDPDESTGAVMGFLALYVVCWFVFMHLVFSTKIKNEIQSNIEKDKKQYELCKDVWSSHQKKYEETFYNLKNSEGEDKQIYKDELNRLNKEGESIKKEIKGLEKNIKNLEEQLKEV